MNMKERIILGFTEWLLHSKLFEMATTKSKVEEKVEEYRDTINIHLLKIYLMVDSIDREHWKEEVEGYFDKIYGYRWNGKNHLKEKEYFRILYTEYFLIYEVEMVIKKMKTKYKDEYFINYNDIEFKNMCDSFYGLVCNHIANEKYDFEKVYKYLEIFDTK